VAEHAAAVAPLAAEVPLALASVAAGRPTPPGPRRGARPRYRDRPRRSRVPAAERVVPMAATTGPRSEACRHLASARHRAGIDRPAERKLPIGQASGRQSVTSRAKVQRTTLLIFREAECVPAPALPLPAAPPHSSYTIARLAIFQSAEMERADRLAPPPVQESAILPAILAVRSDLAQGAVASHPDPAATIVRIDLDRVVVVSKSDPAVAIVLATASVPMMAIVPATGRAAIGGRSIVQTR
jgi:hypothetical protein